AVKSACVEYELLPLIKSSGVSSRKLSSLHAVIDTAAAVTISILLNNLFIISDYFIDLEINVYSECNALHHGAVVVSTTGNNCSTITVVSRHIRFRIPSVPSCDCEQVLAAHIDIYTTK